MARRWRIRHKLMLGLATAIAILAMLLAGPLSGLWSYYVTMRSIKSKLAELEVAEMLKAAIRDLTLSDNVLADLPKYEKKIAEAGKTIGAVEKAVQNTRDLNLSDDDGEHLLGLCQDLRGQLAGLRVAVSKSKDLEGSDFEGTQQLFDKVRSQIDPKVKELGETSDDLRSKVRVDLNNLIGLSRRNYQVPVAILTSVSVFGLLLLVSALRLFYCWVFNPVRDLQNGVNRVAEGDFDHRIEVKSGDEMEELAAAFNDMASRLRDLYRDMARQINERSRQLVRSERLASVGFLAAGVAHEINNPLASIAFCSEALEARLEEIFDFGFAIADCQTQGAGHRPKIDNPKSKIENHKAVFAKYLKMIQEEAFRCKSITERLLEFSRGGERKRERTDLAQLVQSVLDITQHLPNSRGKDIVFRNPVPVFAWVSVEEIKSVVLNLVVNALDSMDEGGRVTIDLKTRDGLAELVVSDTGCGMTAEVLENIFEPFFTRNRSGKGTGLGLTITHRIVSQHGGEIEAASPGAGQGSTFRVRLPLQPAEAGGTGKEESLGNAA